MSCIYGIKDLLTDEVIYVGQTMNFNSRKGIYLNNIKSSDTKREVVKYMRSFHEWQERFEVYKIRDCTVVSASDFESYYIQNLNPICNVMRPKYNPRQLFKISGRPEGRCE